MSSPTDVPEVPVEAKVLTVSDGVVAGTRVDASGDRLEEVLTEHGFRVVDRVVCADGTASVAEALRNLTRGFVGVIVTTGGTGFSPRDLTPEGTKQVIEREAPGLAEAMRAVSPLGRLSRGIAGTVDRVLICNTPGSPKGCVEHLEAIIEVLAHAVRLLNDEATPH